ncbi:MAG: aldehyde reductase, partial [Pseudomonadota bacterium]
GDGKGLELVTINPVAVLGPVMSGDFSASLEIILQLMGGALPATPKFGFSIVDVRDVAELHVLAMENPDADGERFISSEGFMMFSDMADLLREHFPDYAKKLPKGNLPDWLLRLVSIFNPVLKQVLPELGKRRESSFEKAMNFLGWTPRTAEEAVLSAAHSLKKHGVI